MCWRHSCLQMEWDRPCESRFTGKSSLLIRMIGWGHYEWEMNFYYQMHGHLSAVVYGSFSYSNKCSYCLMLSIVLVRSRMAQIINYCSFKKGMWATDWPGRVTWDLSFYASCSLLFKVGPFAIHLLVTRWLVCPPHPIYTHIL